jgi:hypothetical protein
MSFSDFSLGVETERNGTRKFLALGNVLASLTLVTFMERARFERLCRDGPFLGGGVSSELDSALLVLFHDVELPEETSDSPK